MGSTDKNFGWRTRDRDMVPLMRILDRLFGGGRRIEVKLDRIITLLEVTMGKLEDLVVALDEETNKVAARIDKLSEDLQSAISDGVAPSEATLASLQAISARLKSLGTDTSVPIPPEPPTDTIPDTSTEPTG